MDRDKTPPYLLIANALGPELARMEPGSRVPSEHELARRYDINRLTAKAALEELERRYAVRRVQGKGTFVARRLPYEIDRESPVSWSLNVRRAGATPSIVTDALVQRRASAAVREHLELDTGAQVFRLQRRRFIDGLIAGCTDSYLPVDTLPDLKERLGHDESLHEVMTTTYGLTPARSWIRIELRIAPPDVAARLALRGAPVVHVLSACVVAEDTGRPVEYGISWFRPDAVDLVVELH